MAQRKPHHHNDKAPHNLDALHHLMNRLQPFTPSEHARISFESLKKGTGGYTDYADLADAINVSMVRAEKIDPQAVAMVMLAHDAMMRVAERFERTEQWGFDGPAIAEVAEALDFYDQLLALSTPLQMHMALLEVKQRCDRIRADKKQGACA